MNKPFSFAVGHSAPQIEAHEKVTGTAHYIADLYHPNMLHGALLPLNILRLVELCRLKAAPHPGVRQLAQTEA